MNSQANAHQGDRQMQASEQERMQDVQLLLDNLFRREEATVRMVLDCLLDVGSNHWIYQNVRAHTGQKVLKGTVWSLQPMAKAIAMAWFKRNVPELLTTWLYSQVIFESDSADTDAQDDSAPSLPPQEPNDHLPGTTLIPETMPMIEFNSLENRTLEQLQRQVRLFQGITIGAIATLIGTWIA